MASWPDTLSVAQFHKAAKDYAASEPDCTWIEHATYPALGYLRRDPVIRLFCSGLARAQSPVAPSDSPDNELEDEDEHVRLPNGRDTQEVDQQRYTVQFDVCYNTMYQVPALHFSVARADDTLVLNLDEIQASSCVLKQPDVALNLGEHPSTGSYATWWGVDACGTTAAMADVLSLRPAWVSDTQEGWEKDWLSSWVAVMRCGVDF